MKNQTQTVLFPANTLVPSLPELNLHDFKDKLAALKASPDDQRIRDELKAQLSKESQLALAEINAELPTDNVPISINLGQFLYELLLQVQPEHVAPLQIALQKKYLTDLAVRLNQKEFNLEPFELHNLKKVLEDDERWSKINVVAFIEGNKQSKEVRLVASGIKYFDKILNACIEPFLPQEDKKSKTKR